MEEPIGDVDIYFEGGTNQPKFRMLLGLIKDYFGICSHSLSVNYVASTFDGTAVLTARQCEDYGAMQRGEGNGKEIHVGGLQVHEKQGEEGIFLCHPNQN